MKNIALQDLTPRLYGLYARLYAKLLYKSLISSVTLLFLSYSPMTQSNNISLDAVRLVHAMQLNQVALFTLQKTFLPAQDKGGLKSDKEKFFFECLSAVDPSIYTSIYADELVKQMSAEEIKEAVIFFEGLSGRKYTERELLQMLLIFDNAQAEQLQEFSREEVIEVEQFKKTTAGEKLLLKGVPNTNVVLLLVVEKNQEIAQECGRKAT